MAILLRCMESPYPDLQWRLPLLALLFDETTPVSTTLVFHDPLLHPNG